MEVIKVKQVIPIIIFDIIAIIIMYFVPAIAHVVSFPLQLLEPFRIVIFLSYFLLNNKRNTIFMALTLPLFSFIVSGHPLFFKMLLMSIELVCNIVILDWMRKRTSHLFLSLFASILLSKVLYYLLKYVLLSQSLLDSKLVSTPLYAQLLVALGTALLFSLFNKKEIKSYE